MPRGTTAGQILREKGVFAIMDATAGAASSDSDAETGPDALAVELASSRGSGSSSSSSAGSKGGRSRQQQWQQAGLAADAQLVNVNNRLVSEDTVLQDGDLVILAREKIKI